MRAGPAFDIASLHAAYQDGFTAADMIDTVFARIAKVNDPGIFIHLADNGDLLAQAEALGVFDPVTKPLWGIPFAVKGNIDVAGMPTTAACPDYSYVPEADATVVRLLRQAGALVIGKTNLDQFATGLVGADQRFRMGYATALKVLENAGVETKPDPDHCASQRTNANHPSAA